MSEGAEDTTMDVHPATDTSSDARLNVVEVEDVPPNGGYGWICAACVFLINANTWGVNSAWGVFLARYLADSTFSGATHLQFAFIGGLSISQALLISPLVGLATARFGARPTMIAGALITSVALLTSSYATRVWHLFLSQGACFGYGMGFLYIPAVGVLPAWFSSKRSLAVGIASSGAGFGGLAYNLGAGAGVRTIGLPQTYKVLALSTCIANVGAAALLKSRRSGALGRRRQERYFDARELRDVPVLLIVAWGFLAEIGYITLLYSLPAYAESIGLSIKQGSIVGAVLNLGLALGRPVVGWVSDRLGRINVATAMTASCGLFCFALWIPAHSYGLLLVFALAAGTSTGTFWACVMPVTAEVVGLRRLSAAFAVVCLPLVLPTTFAEAIAVELTSKYGYLASQGFVGSMFLASAASAWGLRAWKINDIEERQRDAPRSLRKRWHWLTPRHWFHLTRV